MDHEKIRGAESDEASLTELAAKTVRRARYCVSSNCAECDLNKNFDGGACYDEVMEDFIALTLAAYPTVKNKEEKRT